MNAIKAHAVFRDMVVGQLRRHWPHEVLAYEREVVFMIDGDERLVDVTTAEDHAFNRRRYALATEPESEPTA